MDRCQDQSSHYLRFTLICGRGRRMTTLKINSDKMVFRNVTIAALRYVSQV